MKSVSEMVLVFAEIYGEEMTEQRLKAYEKVLSDLSQRELNLAFKVIMNNPWIKKMPLPGEIRSSARPELRPREEAIRRLELIRGAVRKFGWPNPQGAQEFLGPVLWLEVCRMGGWEHLCSSPELNLNDTTVYAQTRDRMTSSVQADRFGVDFDSKALSSGESKMLEKASEKS